MNDFSGFAAVIAANAGTAARQRLVHVARAWRAERFVFLFPCAYKRCMGMRTKA